MADYIFLNPSANLLLLSENVKSRGYSVKLVKNEQFPDISPDNVHIFYNGTFSSFSRKANASGSLRPFMKLHKGILSGLVNRQVRKELASYSSCVGCGDVVDLSLLKRQALETAKIQVATVSSATSFSDIAEDNSDAVIVTGYMEFVAGSEKLTMYDTDFDIKEALGNDYFVLMLNGVRIEMCCSGNRLITIGHKKDDVIPMLCAQMPFLTKFGFKRVKELIISRNRMPWVVNSLDKGLMILNDYSYFNASVKLGPDWFDKVGKYICSGKHR